MYYNVIDAMNIFEPGQNREIAALRIPIHVHHFFLGDYMDNEYMKVAFEEAKKAYLKNEIPVGAVIVMNDKIISKAHNLKDSTGIVTKHAEIIAIEKANELIGDWRLKDAVMYVTLEPCPMCASAIQQSRIRKVVYSLASNNSENTSIIKKIFNNKSSNNIVTFEKSNYKFEKENIVSDFFKKIR